MESGKSSRWGKEHRRRRSFAAAPPAAEAPAADTEASTPAPTAAPTAASGQVGEECLGYDNNPCAKGLICENPKKPGVNVNGCAAGHCKCQIDSQTTLNGQWVITADHWSSTQRNLGQERLLDTTAGTFGSPGTTYGTYDRNVMTSTGLNTWTTHEYYYEDSTKHYEYYPSTDKIKEKSEWFPTTKFYWFSRKQALHCTLDVQLFFTSIRNKQLEDRSGTLGLHNDKGGNQKWVITNAGDGKVFFTSHRNQQLQDASGTLRLDNNKGTWEKWAISDAGGGKVFITSHRNQQLEDRSGTLGLHNDKGGYQKWDVRKLDNAAGCILASTPAPTAAPTAASAAAPTIIWEKNTKKHCAQNKFPHAYGTLAAAKEACAQMMVGECNGVYDASCDDMNTFYICGAGDWAVSSSSSCIYMAQASTPAPTAAPTAASTDGDTDLSPELQASGTECADSAMLTIRQCQEWTEDHHSYSWYGAYGNPYNPKGCWVGNLDMKVYFGTAATGRGHTRSRPVCFTAATGATHTAAKLKSEEEAAAKLKAEEEAATKLKAEEAAAAELKAEEEAAAKRKAEEEAAAKLKAEEETAAKLKAEEEAAAKLKAEEEAAAKLKAEEEAAAKLKAEEEAAAKLKAEQEAEAPAADKAATGAAEKLSEGRCKGDVIRKVSISTVGDCQSYCEETEGCKFFSFRESKKKCEASRKCNSFSGANKDWMSYKMP